MRPSEKSVNSSLDTNLHMLMCQMSERKQQLIIQTLFDKIGVGSVAAECIQSIGCRRSVS